MLGVHRGDGHRDLPAVRPAARPARHADCAGGGHARGRARHDRRARAPRPAARAGDRAGGALPGAAGGRPAVRAQPAKAARRAAGIPSRRASWRSTSTSRPAKYPKERRPVVYQRAVWRNCARQPGVVSAAQVNMTPISGSGWNEGVRPDAFTGEPKNSFFNRYGLGYLKTMGTRAAGGPRFQRARHGGRTQSGGGERSLRQALLRRQESGGPHLPRRGRRRTAGSHLPDRGPGAEHQVLRAARGLHPDRASCPIAQDENPRERRDVGGAHVGPSAGCLPRAQSTRWRR